MGGKGQSNVKVMLSFAWLRVQKPKMFSSIPHKTKQAGNDPIWKAFESFSLTKMSSMVICYQNSNWWKTDLILHANSVIVVAVTQAPHPLHCVFVWGEEEVFVTLCVTFWAALCARWCQLKSLHSLVCGQPYGRLAGCQQNLSSMMIPHLKVHKCFH